MRHISLFLAVLLYTSFQPTQTAHAQLDSYTQRALLEYRDTHRWETSAYDGYHIPLSSLIPETVSRYPVTALAKVDPKLGELAQQTIRVWGIGALDAHLKANWIATGTRLPPWLRANGNPLEGEGLYGSGFIGLMTLSAIDYGFNRDATLFEKVRYTASQMIVSNVMEHFFYWIQLQLAGIQQRDGWNTNKVFSLQDGPRYPEHVNWMEKTAAGYVAQLRGEPAGQVSRESVFVTIPTLYALAYIITPKTTGEISARESMLTPSFYIAGPGDRYQQGIPYLNTIRSGLNVSLPADVKITFFQTVEGNPRAALRIPFGSVVGITEFAVEREEIDPFIGDIGVALKDVTFSNGAQIAGQLIGNIDTQSIYWSIILAF